MSNVKYMDIGEFRQFGFLQEVNRQFLHPLGLALEIVIQEDGSETLGGIWDYRTDPEGMIYSKDIASSQRYQDNYERVNNLKEEMNIKRLSLLGYVIQPI